MVEVKQLPASDNNPVSEVVVNVTEQPQTLSTLPSGNNPPAGTQPLVTTNRVQEAKQSQNLPTVGSNGLFSVQNDLNSNDNSNKIRESMSWVAATGAMVCLFVKYLTGDNDLAVTVGAFAAFLAYIKVLRDQSQNEKHLDPSCKFDRC